MVSEGEVEEDTQKKVDQKSIKKHRGMPERLKGPVSKTGAPQNEVPRVRISLPLPLLNLTYF